MYTNITTRHGSVLVHGMADVASRVKGAVSDFEIATTDLTMFEDQVRSQYETALTSASTIKQLQNIWQEFKVAKDRANRYYSNAKSNNHLDRVERYKALLSANAYNNLATSLEVIYNQRMNVISKSNNAAIAKYTNPTNMSIANARNKMGRL